MPKIAPPISDVALKAHKPGDKFYTVAVGGDGVGGLRVMIFPSGNKVFKLSYHFGGKEKLLTIGKYGDFSLAEARDKAREAKRLIAQGEDPSALKKREKAKTKADVTFPPKTSPGDMIGGQGLGGLKVEGVLVGGSQTPWPSHNPFIAPDAHGVGSRGCSDD